MTKIYTRNFHGQYSPPPGYDGIAFSEPIGMKHHPPEDEVPAYIPEDTPEEKNDCITDELPLQDSSGDNLTKAEKTHHAVHNEHPLEDLLRSLRGKIGREELIILLVMLLIASDGVGIEVLILGIILIAG